MVCMHWRKYYTAVPDDFRKTAKSFRVYETLDLGNRVGGQTIGICYGSHALRKCDTAMPWRIFYSL